MRSERREAAGVGLAYAAVAVAAVSRFCVAAISARNGDTYQNLIALILPAVWLSHCPEAFPRTRAPEWSSSPVARNSLKSAAIQKYTDEIVVGVPARSEDRTASFPQIAPQRRSFNYFDTRDAEGEQSDGTVSLRNQNSLHLLRLVEFMLRFHPSSSDSVSHFLDVRPVVRRSCRLPPQVLVCSQKLPLLRLPARRDSLAASLLAVVCQRAAAAVDPGFSFHQCSLPLAVQIRCSRWLQLHPPAAKILRWVLSAAARRTQSSVVALRYSLAAGLSAVPPGPLDHLVW